ncbi:MAG: DUF2911 domain-containing protein [Chitinophagaceae bacterium]
MKIIRHVSLIFFISLYLLSCNSKGEKNTPGVKEITIKDTNTIKDTQGSAVNSYASIDLSPMDMSYFPVDYPKIKMSDPSAAPPMARVIYSRPHLQGRHIFHEVLKYGEPWRMGANEATELDLFIDVIIQGKKIKQGRYVLYCIPQKDTWIIVFNSNIDSWGLQPDPTKDIARFEVPVKSTGNSLEFFTIVFEKIHSGANLLMAWDNAEVRLPINF